MTYRNDASYTRFPEKAATVPAESIRAAGPKMDELIVEAEEKHHLREQSFVTDQNVYDDLEVEE